MESLDLVKRLNKMLMAKNVRYCHWKSNAALQRSAFGKNDLDLLIHRSDKQSFLEILDYLGFKEVCGADEITGIKHYYGYDFLDDVIVHVHAHYQLVIGDDFYKNYRIPIETQYLKNTKNCGLFRVPSPEFEFLLFVIRMVIKHSTWDTILTKHGWLSKSEAQEFEYLINKVEKPQLSLLLKRNFPYFEEGLFESCVEAIQPGQSIWNRIRTGFRLEHALHTYTRKPQWLATFTKFLNLFLYIIRRKILKQGSRKNLTDGGILIAILGGDGAGKTTAISGITQWLSKVITIKTFHLGKPAWSLTTISALGFLKLLRVLRVYPLFVRLAFNIDDSKRFLELVKAVCTARDRFLSYKKARRLATNGSLVVCDRYPLPNLVGMDGPRANNNIKIDSNNRMQVNLASLEKNFYQRIMPPDLLIVLRVDPEIAVKRKIEEDESSVRSRSTEIWNKDWNQSNAYVVDASFTQVEVLSKIKAFIWKEL